MYSRWLKTQVYPILLRQILYQVSAPHEENSAYTKLDRASSIEKTLPMKIHIHAQSTRFMRTKINLHAQKLVRNDFVPHEDISSCTKTWLSAHEDISSCTKIRPSVHVGKYSCTLDQFFVHKEISLCSILCMLPVSNVSDDVYRFLHTLRTKHCHFSTTNHGRNAIDRLIITGNHHYTTHDILIHPVFSFRSRHHLSCHGHDQHLRAYNLPPMTPLSESQHPK